MVTGLRSKKSLGAKDVKGNEGMRVTRQLKEGEDMP